MQSARKSHIQEIRSKIEGLLKNSGLTTEEVYPAVVGKATKIQGLLLRPSTATRRTPPKRGRDVVSTHYGSRRP